MENQDEWEFFKYSFVVFIISTLIWNISSVDGLTVVSGIIMLMSFLLSVQGFFAGASGSYDKTKKIKNDAKNNFTNKYETIDELIDEKERIELLKDSRKYLSYVEKYNNCIILNKYMAQLVLRRELPKTKDLFSFISGSNEYMFASNEIVTIIALNFIKNHRDITHRDDSVYKNVAWEISTYLK